MISRLRKGERAPSEALAVRLETAFAIPRGSWTEPTGWRATVRNLPNAVPGGEGDKTRAPLPAMGVRECGATPLDQGDTRPPLAPSHRGAA